MTCSAGLGVRVGEVVTMSWCLSTAIMHREKVEVKLNMDNGQVKCKGTIEAKLHLNSSGRKEKAEQREARGGSNQLVANT